MTDRNVPPPGGATATPEEEKTATNKNQPNNDTKQAENKPESKADKDENGFPTPNFSALGKWYDIVRYEYDSTGRYISLYVKPKADGDRETEFYMEYTDKDGIVYD